MECKKTQRNVIQVTDNQELYVIGNKRNGIIVKGKDGKLIINILNKKEVPNVSIYNANLAEINNYTFAYLLEEYNRIPSNNKPISEILNNQYNIFLGKNNIDKEIDKIEFQIVSYFKKE